VDIAFRCARFDIRFDFHGFPIYKIGVDCQALSADMNIPIGSTRLYVRLDFHACVFLS
jgi:hypothetical protein